MNKQKVFLFILRLFFYFSVTALILIHPGIQVTFDRIGVMQWFVVIPLLAVTAFFPVPDLKFRKRSFIALAFLLPLSLFAGGFSLGTLQVIAAGTVSFFLTFLLFNQQPESSQNLLLRSAAKLAALEPFFLAWVALRLLSLSRSGEEIAGQSVALTQFILVWTAVVFLLHCVVVYFCLYPQSANKSGKEAALIIASSLAALILVLVVLPPDFVRNTVIENLISERVPERIRDGSDRGIPRDGSGRRDGRRTLPLDEGGSGQRLRGIPDHNWQNRTGRGRRGEGSADNRQYMVKIVASEYEPVYMGNSINGHLDPILGFTASPEESFNRLANQRFFVTWFNHEHNFDIGRERQQIISLSTLPQKYFPWQPQVIDPTILNEDSGPLKFIHQVESNTHEGDPILLVNSPSRSLSMFEEIQLEHYLEIPLEETDLQLFSNWLDDALKNWQANRESFISGDRYLSSVFSLREEGFGLRPVNEHLETILAMLTAFSKYQYDLNYTDDHSIEALKEFLFNSMDGDCVEFSNTLALLGRIAGIPSRVVTGYLVAESLQTQAHLQGLFNLQQRIPFLQQFPFENLFMVTNLHAHSWTQFYIPDYGWLDFESTLFAIPPEGTGDFNTWDVVIPLIDENRIFSNVRKFPWRAVLRGIAAMAVIALTAAYALRYGREIFLHHCSKQVGREGARALYLLLLAKLAADGKPIKPASKTATEYAEIFGKILSQRHREHEGTEFIKAQQDHFKKFAELYSELRWRQFENTDEMEQRYTHLKQEYHTILNTMLRQGFGWQLVRIFNLRGLAYL